MTRTGYAILLIAFLLFPVPAIAQTTPPSLLVGFPSLTLRFDGKLNETEGTAAAPCVALTAPAPGPVTKSFNVAQMPFVGNWTHYQEITLVIVFTAATPGTIAASSGFSAAAELIAKTSRLVSATSTYTYAPGDQAPTSTTFTFPAGENATQGELGVRITLTPTQTGGTAQNVAVQCDRGSKLDPLKILRGTLGDEDTDGDGIPDLEDSDDDGDGISDAEEAGIRCAIGDRTYDFSKDANLQPGDHDGDGDGGTDEAECAAGYDPTSALNRIPPPKPFPWGLMILALLVLGAAAGLYFFLTTFGKSAALTVVSTSELFIKPGTTGKYEIEATSLRKKGNPIAYQLSAQGTPQGWDAKLNPDHVTLESVGTGKDRGRVYLTVESPEHTEAESAVVSVKAIALNKAGRKDTWKLPARAKTITSINVPPGAKVPVKRGGPVAMRTEEEAAKEAEGPALRVPRPWVGDVHKVIDIEGIGPEFAEKLAKAGVETTAQLLEAKASKLARKTGIPEATIHTWQSMSDLIRVNGIGPQIAELLARAGVRSANELARETPKGLVKRIEDYLATLERRPTKAPATEKTAKDWIAGAEALLMEEAKSDRKKERKEKPAEAPTPAAGGTAKPQLQVGGLAHEPPVFREGESVKSTVTVSNAGDQEQKIKLNLFVNDGLADAQTVSIKAGKSKDVKFKWTAQARNKLNIRGELVGG